MPLPDYGMGAPKIWKGRVRLLPQAVFFAYSKCLYARFGRIFGRPDKKKPGLKRSGFPFVYRRSLSYT